LLFHGMSLPQSTEGRLGSHLRGDRLLRGAALGAPVRLEIGRYQGPTYQVRIGCGVGECERAWFIQIGRHKSYRRAGERFYALEALTLMAR
jgi:hypothetical protein